MEDGRTALELSSMACDHSPGAQHAPTQRPRQAWHFPGLSPLTGSLTTEVMDWRPGTFSAFHHPLTPEPFPGGSAGKESTLNAGDLHWVPSPGEGKGYPLQDSGLERSMDCIVHGVAKSRTRPNDFHLLPLPPIRMPQHTFGH